MLIADLLKAPPRLWTIAQYAGIGETEPGYTELVAGRLLISPSPTPDHQAALIELAIQLQPQLPADLAVILGVDIDLELDAPNAPGFSRRPDFVIVSRDAPERVANEGGMLRASEVALVGELATPDSRRIDMIDKRGEYSEAGIPWYWIVEITGPVSLVACRGMTEQRIGTGTFTTNEPFPITLELDRLC